MTATYNSNIVLNKTPPLGGHGEAGASVTVHATATLGAALGAGDVINMCSLPVNAVLTGVMLRAATQLDSNVSPSLTFEVGISGTASLFMASNSSVGRAATVTSSSTLATVGGGYKNTSGADLPVIVTANGAAATGVAGTLELFMQYFLEPAVGSPA